MFPIDLSAFFSPFVEELLPSQWNIYESSLNFSSPFQPLFAVKWWLRNNRKSFRGGVKKRRKWELCGEVTSSSKENASIDLPWRRRLNKERRRQKSVKAKSKRLWMPVNSNPMCIILRKVNHHWLLWFLSALVVNGAVAGNPDAKRLYDDLLSNYNKLVRPVVNTSDVLRVCIKLKLSQLIDVVSWMIS